MKLSAILLVAAAVGIVGGAALIGLWAIGLAVIADSLALAAFALLWDRPDRSEPTVNSVGSVLERFRRSA